MLFVSCNNYVENNNIAQEKTEIIKKEIELQPVLTYHFDTIRNDSMLKKFKSNYTLEQQKIIAATNRLDISRIRIKTALIIPDTLLNEFIQYSPFPNSLNLPDSILKFVLINQRLQLFAAYENKKIIRFGPVSSGKKSKPTPNGLFYANYKSKRKISTVNGNWIMPWYFNIANKAGIGMHQYLLPGYPASHSCIRMYEEDAKWLYDWAQQWQITANGASVIKNGTPVLLFGRYDFNGVSAWKQLPENPKSLELTEQELNEINDAITKVKIMH
jgi:lipoprotein-anchoring transpeptidase ErfK/SrfK